MLPHSDYLIVALRFAVVYGATWGIVGRPLSRGVGEAVGCTVLLAHFASFAVFSIIWSLGLPYTWWSSLAVLGLVLLLLRWGIPARPPDEPEAVDPPPGLPRWAWIAAALYLTGLFALYSYRWPAGGAYYHLMLNLWRHTLETGQAYADLSAVPFSFKTSALYFGPLVHANGLIVATGARLPDAAITAYGLVQLAATLGCFAFAHATVGLVVGSAALTAALPLLFATWRPDGAYSYLFMPDHNGFTPILAMAGLYFVLRTRRDTTLLAPWLALMTALLGFANRPWMGFWFAPLALVFAPVLLRRLGAQRRELVTPRWAALFVAVIVIGAYWPVGVFGAGRLDQPYGVYQEVLERGYTGGGADGTGGAIVQPLQAVPGRVTGQLAASYVRPGAGFLPRYLSILGLAGWLVLGVSRTGAWAAGRVMLAAATGLAVTGWLSPPLYPRSYLWLLPVLLTGVAVGVEQVTRFAPARARARGITLAAGAGVTLGVYLVVCLGLHASGRRQVVTTALGLDGLPGVADFYRGLDNLARARADSQRMAAELRPHLGPDGRVLHTSSEPGVDLDAFLPGVRWWEQDLLHANVVGDHLFDTVFPDWRTSGASPCDLARRRIRVLDVTLSFDLLLGTRSWTPEARVALEDLQGWITDHPGLFRVVSRGYAGRTVYAVDTDGIVTTFGCRRA